MAAIKHITYFSSTDQGLAVCVLLLVIASLVSLIAAHFVDRGVDPVSMAVSDYGARENPWFYRLAAVWLGLAGLLTAVMIGDAMYPKPTGTILALLVFAAARWAITIFPTDVEGEEETPVGRAHFVLAVVAFGTIGFAAAIFATVIGPDPFWADYESLLTILGIGVALLAILTGVARAAFPQIFGLVERLLYLAIFGWFAAIALIALSA